MRRDQVIRRLRELETLRAQRDALEAMVDEVDLAMANLSDCERDIIETFYVIPRQYAAERMCEKYMIERATVYRRRQKGLRKLENLLSEMRDKSETT